MILSDVDHSIDCRRIQTHNGMAALGAFIILRCSCSNCLLVMFKGAQVFQPTIGDVSYNEMISKTCNEKHPTTKKNENMLYRHSMKINEFATENK